MIDVLNVILFAGGAVTALFSLLLFAGGAFSLPALLASLLFSVLVAFVRPASQVIKKGSLLDLEREMVEESRDWHNDFLDEQLELTALHEGRSLREKLYSNDEECWRVLRRQLVKARPELRSVLTNYVPREMAILPQYRVFIACVSLSEEYRHLARQTYHGLDLNTGKKLFSIEFRGDFNDFVVRLLPLLAKNGFFNLREKSGYTLRYLRALRDAGINVVPEGGSNVDGVKK